MLRLSLCLLSALFAAGLGCSSSDSGSCAQIAGNWALSGTCGTGTCSVSQNGCTLSASCFFVSYTGSIAGNTATLTSTGGGATQTCQGTLVGSTLSGTCSSVTASCSFTANR